MNKYHEGFVSSELGRIRVILPLSEIAFSIAVRFKKHSRKDKKSMFPSEGKIALMFLMSYTGLSDDGLIEMLNGSVYMQLFCGVLIEPCNPIKEGKIVSAIRNQLSGANFGVRAEYPKIRSKEMICFLGFDMIIL